MIKISVVIPVYKTKKEFLFRCIESVSKQTYQNFEVILVDDGSPDDCGAVCDELAKSDDKIKVIHQKNQGVSNARNNGIMNATGDWITFVDSDDWIDLDTFQHVVSLIGQNKGKEIDIITFSMVVHNNNKDIQNPFLPKEKTGRLNEEDLEELKKQIFHKAYSKFKPASAMVGVVACKVYRRDFLNELNLRFNEDLKFSEDGLFAYHAFSSSDKIYYLDRCMYHYRIHEDSATSKFRQNAIEEYTISLEALDRVINETKGSEGVRMAFYYRVVISLFAIMNQYILDKRNELYFIERIKAIKNLISKELYHTALLKIPVVDVYHNSSKARGFGFALIKGKAVVAFYFYMYLSRAVKSFKKA